MSPAPSLTVGSTFHNWKLERVLARGGSATVYAATNPVGRRRAAIKVIAPTRGSSTDEVTITRFFTEVEVHASVPHANMPELYDAELMPDGTAVLVLELLDGSDLAGVVRQLERLAVADALFILSEVLRALEALHRTGVHRDIKPSNVFVRRAARRDLEGRVEKRRVTLLDFGITKLKLKAGVTKQNTVVGTPCYISPEQLRGLPVDGRADLYSAGAVFYETLCGHPPFVPDVRKMPSYGELVLKHLSEPLPDLRSTLPELPAEVWELARRLLAKEPADRYPTAVDAFTVVRALATRHAAGAHLFREEIAGAASDVLPAVSALHDEPTELADEGPPTEAMPAPTLESAQDEAPPTEQSPACCGTERLSPEAGPFDPWQERQLASAQKLLRAPRIFRAPAVARIDTATGEIAGLRAVETNECRIGSGPDTLVRVLAPDVLPHHATLRRRGDGRLDLEVSRDATLGRGFEIDGATTAAGEIVHGTRFRCGGIDFQIVDRAIVDPPPQLLGPTRQRSPMLVHISRSTGTFRDFRVLNAPLALIGSMPGCHLIVPNVAPICAGIWLRGDGELELAEIDASVLPFGQAVTACRLLSDGDVIELGGDEAVRIDDPRGS